MLRKQSGDQPSLILFLRLARPALQLGPDHTPPQNGGQYSDRFKTSPRYLGPYCIVKSQSDFVMLTTINKVLSRWIVWIQPELRGFSQPNGFDQGWHHRGWLSHSILDNTYSTEAKLVLKCCTVFSIFFHKIHKQKT